MDRMEIKYPVIISISASRTINIGNYESIKVTAGLSYPIENKNINSAYKKVSKTVEKLLDKEIEKYIRKFKKEQIDINSIVEEEIE